MRSSTLAGGIEGPVLTLDGTRPVIEIESPGEPLSAVWEIS
jgi:hypothetical protein